MPKHEFQEHDDTLQILLRFLPIFSGSSILSNLCKMASGASGRKSVVVELNFCPVARIGKQLCQFQMHQILLIACAKFQVQLQSSPKHQRMFFHWHDLATFASMKACLLDGTVVGVKASIESHTQRGKEHSNGNILVNEFSTSRSLFVLHTLTVIPSHVFSCLMSSSRHPSESPASNPLETADSAVWLRNSCETDRPTIRDSALFSS